MIDGYIWYHGSIRKAVVAFGTVFNNIHIQRKTSDGELKQTLKVPLSYGPKQKWLSRIRQNPDFKGDSRVEISVPRLAFNIESLERDVARGVTATTQRQVSVNNNTSLNMQYTPVTWKLNFGLFVFTKNQDDNLQIVEQILPFFNPEYNIRYNEMPDMNLVHDYPIVLESVMPDNDWEGDLMSENTLTWQLNFTTKINIFGPIYKQGLIRRAIANVYPNKPGYEDQGGERYTVELNPFDADPTDDYDILEQWEAIPTNEP